MNLKLSRAVTTRWEYHLLFFSGTIALACLAYIPYTPGPIFPDIPAVTIPLVIFFCLGLFTVRIQQRYASDQLKQIVTYGWIGTLVSAAISGWWIALYLYTGLPISGLADQILTVVSGGLGAGVLIGHSGLQNQQVESPSDPVVSDQQNEQPTDRDRVISEVAWTNRAGSNPILDAVIEVLAETEGVDPIELDPLYTYIDPNALSELQTHDSPPWQLLFHTDKYEIRVSSFGTVTAYETDSANQSSRNVSP